MPLYYCHRGIGGGGAIGGGRAKVVLYKSPPAPVFRCTAGTAVVGCSSGGGAGSGNFIVQGAVVTSRQRVPPVPQEPVISQGTRSPVCSLESASLFNSEPIPVSGAYPAG